MIKTFIPLLSLVAAVGLYFVHIEPTLANIKILREEESAFSEALVKTRQLEEIKERLSTQLLSFDDEKLEALEKFLPSTIDNVHLVFDVNSIAEQYNSDLISAEVVRANTVQRNVNDATLEDSYQTVVFKFSVDMNYKIFLAFIADLERSLKLMDVSSIHFSTGISTQGVGAGSAMIIEVQFNTYSSN